MPTKLIAEHNQSTNQHFRTRNPQRNFRQNVKQSESGKSCAEQTHLQALEQCK